MSLPVVRQVPEVLVKGAVFLRYYDDVIDGVDILW